MVEVSKDDKVFLKTVEESTIKSGDHYIVPRPFKKDNLFMPNNRKLAMQRLIYLKKDSVRILHSLKITNSS